MVASIGIGFLLTTYLLASSPNNSNRRRSNGNKLGSSESDNVKKIGRKRYGREGKRSTSGRGGRGPIGGGRKGNRQSDNSIESIQEVSPLPQITTKNGPRLSYFTCRHSYEDTLIEEIQMRAQLDDISVKAYSPYPGLVRVEEEGNGKLPPFYDPVYALGSMPDAVVVSGESIKNVAKEVYRALFEKEGLQETFRSAPRGSLAIHGLVPGMCKGQRNPVMLNRSLKIADELGLMLKKQFPAARKKATTQDDDDNAKHDIIPEEKWILQVMLQNPSLAVASLTQCKHIGPGANCYWPNWYHPLGLAKVDIEEVMPSSAYRKLMEAFECMRIRPSAQSSAVDLGACPGGWSTVLRMLDCQVFAVDRSPLDKKLMIDEMVTFVKGDAFTYVPETMLESRVSSSQSLPNSWMVSDVIAYPERATELLDRWCGGRWVSNLIVTMKFQGDKPTLSEIDTAIQVAKKHGYNCRAKHFFNNKNEITLMASEINPERNENVILEEGVLGTPMYQVTLPKPGS